MISLCIASYKDGRGALCTWKHWISSFKNQNKFHFNWTYLRWFYLKVTDKFLFVLWHHSSLNLNVIKVILFIIIVIMTKPEDLILNQTSLFDRLQGYYTYFINTYKTDVSIGILEARMVYLEWLWKKYQINHDQIFNVMTEKLKTHEYVTNEKFSIINVEELYFNELGKFMEYKRKLLLAE